ESAAEQRMWSAVAASYGESWRIRSASHRFSTVIVERAFSSAKAVARCSVTWALVVKDRHRTPHALLRGPSPRSFCVTEAQRGTEIFFERTSLHEDGRAAHVACGGGELRRVLANPYGEPPLFNRDRGTRVLFCESGGSVFRDVGAHREGSPPHSTCAARL